jgi:hypothetical protein
MARPQPSADDVYKNMETYPLKVWICTNINIVHGFVSLAPQQRLIDFLNGVPAAESRKEYFLTVSDAVASFPEGEEKDIKSLLINKNNVLFVGLEGTEKVRALRSESGAKLYPAITKIPVKATIHIETKLYIFDYKVTGFMHCAANQKPVELLNSDLRFLPFTDVKISPSLVAGEQEYETDFVAISKQHIIYIEQF